MPRTIVAVVGVVCLFASRPASAAPITVDFTGYFVLFDLYSDAPEFWELRDELAANGVYSGGVVYGDGLTRPASPVYMSITFDSLASNTSGHWQDGYVLNSRFSLGPYQFSTGPAVWSNSLFTAVNGPSITAGSTEMRPDWINVLPGFGSPGGYTFSGDPAVDLAYVWDWRFGAVMQWKNSPFWWAFYGLTPTSVVSVPEPSALVLMGSAIMAGVVIHYRRRRRTYTD